MGFIIIIGLVIILYAILRPRKDPIRRGAEGESKVSSILRRLPKDYYTINNVIVPTRSATSQIDHLVISPYGIFVIETKNYTGWIFGSEDSKKWKETFKTESHYFYNPIKQNWGHIYALSDFINLDKRAFRPVVVFSNDASLNVQSTTPVIYMSQLKKYILSYTQEILSYEEVEEAYNDIKRINLAGTDLGNKHTQIVKDKLTRTKETISQGKCPRCGGDLVLRNGQYGQFYGCSNYPKCRYTYSLR